MVFNVVKAHEAVPLMLIWRSVLGKAAGLSQVFVGVAVTDSNNLKIWLLSVNFRRLECLMIACLDHGARWPFFNVSIDKSLLFGFEPGL